jgi:hypothetical protein
VKGNVETMTGKKRIEAHKLQSSLLVIASFSLFGWVIYLLNALPGSYRAEHWNVAWVGYDLGMSITWLGTSWALWKRRQAAIPGAMISGTFLMVDAWFDVVTSNPGWDFRLALFLALILEIPTALLLFRFSRNAVRRSIENAHAQAGIEVISISLWKTPLAIFEEKK